MIQNIELSPKVYNVCTDQLEKRLCITMRTKSGIADMKLIIIKCDECGVMDTTQVISALQSVISILGDEL